MMARVKREEAVSYQMSDETLCRGIVHRPASSVDTGIGIVILPAGLKYRTGPHRLYVSFARRLAELGYTVLRADLPGIGESESSLGGDIKERWRAIENGEMAQWSIDVARQFSADEACNRCVFMGLCGGAVTSQIAAYRAPDVIHGVISINTAVLLTNCRSQPVMEFISEQQRAANMGSYLDRLQSGEAWRRMFSGQSDYGSILRTLLSRLSDRVSQPKEEESALASVLSHPAVNCQFIESFMGSGAKGLPHLFIFGEKDNRWYQFQDVILRGVLNGDWHLLNYRLVTIKDANHELFLTHWQEQAFDAVRLWLEDEFGRVDCWQERA